MPEVLVRRPPQARSTSAPLVALASAFVVLVLALAVSRLTALPTHISAVSFTNATRFPVNVDVGAVPLGTVAPGSTRSFSEIVDQGAAWRIHFSYAGVEGGTFAVSRAELRRQAWKVAVPAEVDGRLARAGLRPSEES